MRSFWNNRSLSEETKTINYNGYQILVDKEDAYFVLEYLAKRDKNKIHYIMSSIFLIVLSYFLYPYAGLKLVPSLFFLLMFSLVNIAWPLELDMCIQQSKRFSKQLLIIGLVMTLLPILWK